MSKEETIWKDVDGFEGILRVNTLGEVWRYERKWLSGRWITRTSPDKIVPNSIDRKGYYIFRATKGGEHFNLKIHRLVAIAFIPNPENKPQVNHKDGVKTNNHVDNLEWCTASENLHHAHNTGLKISAKGVSHGSSKLKESQIIEIRESQLSDYALAKKYGVVRSTIGAIKKRTLWKHI